MTLYYAAFVQDPDDHSRRVVAVSDLLRQVSAQARQVSFPRPDDTLAAMKAMQPGSADAGGQAPKNPFPDPTAWWAMMQEAAAKAAAAAPAEAKPAEAAPGKSKSK